MTAHAQALAGTGVVVAARELKLAAARLGLDASSDFLATGSEVDTLAYTHTRFRQRYQGVPLWGGEIVAHASGDGRLLSMTNTVTALPRIDTTPRLTRAMALAVADRDMPRHGPYSHPPQAELVIYPLAGRGDGAPRARGYRLAWHLQVATRNAQDGLREMRYFIDAHQGSVLDKWSELQRAHAIGSGARSIFNGLVAVNSNSVAGGYELRDLQRGSGGRFGNNVVLRYVAPGTAAIFTDAGNTWGDGQSYVPGSASQGSDETAQSGGVDVAYGTAVTWDMYRNVFGRAGFDGKGTSVHATVHVQYGSIFGAATGANASWGPLCECMDFGYGDSSIGLKNVVDLDVVGHELTHGVIQKSAGLVYRAEPGGLNEGIADIFGLAAKFYGRGGGYARAATTVGAGQSWSIGEGLGHSRFQRYFKRPSAEAGSFDAWDSSFIDQSGEHGVHRISGPVRRAFYFMSNGASVSGEGASVYLTGGMQGIGIDRSLKIWYRALSYYMTRLTDFAGARQALISASRDLYGAGSDAEQAVWNAFGGINVGAPWAAPACGRLLASQQLAGGQQVSSCDGSYVLAMGADGNLALRNSAGELAWQSATGGHPGARLEMQSDGNLVIYKANGNEALWHAGSWGAAGASVAISADGNLIITAPNGVPVWSLRMWPGAAATIASSQANLTAAKADLVGAATTGITGMASWSYTTGLEAPAYFSFVLPAGKSIRWDFVGGALVSSRWQLEALAPSGIVLASSYSNNTRQQLSYTNRSGEPMNIVLRIGRQNYDTIPDTLTQQYSVAIAYW